MTKTFKIAVYPGDGIGPEVIAEALKVLSRVQELDGSFQLDLTHLPWGVEYYKQHGDVVPENFLEVLRPFDAILLGAVGHPQRGEGLRAWDHRPRHARRAGRQPDRPDGPNRYAPVHSHWRAWVQRAVVRRPRSG